MSNANYFKVEDFPVEYPIIVNYNGKSWNFFRDFQKKFTELDSNPSTNHKLFDMAIEFNVFGDLKFYKNIPFIVTDDIRVEGDKKKYYIVDYLIPSKNKAILITTDKNKNRLGKIRQTLDNLEISYLEINELESKNSKELLSYLRGLNTSLSFMDDQLMIYPNYFEE